MIDITKGGFMTNKIEYEDPHNIVISFDVKDLERAEKFYTEILGFKRGWEGGLEYGWLEIDVPVEGLIIGLNLKKEGEITPGSTTLNIGVKDAEKTKAYLDSKGVKTLEINEIPGMVKLVVAFDPDGNMISFVESLVEES